MTQFKISNKGYISLPQRYQEIDLSLYIQDPQWFEKFVLLCRPATLDEFAHHIGIYSNYLSKAMLLNSLKFHYAVLSGAIAHLDPAFDITDDQKSAVISKINEEIRACTPGFHGRVDSLLEGYFLPKTIDELLKSIRYSIVERTANRSTNEVHANNRFFIVAKQMGYGVPPKLENDPYVGAIPESEIREQLTQAFNEHYQPFSTLLQLKEMIISTFDQYVGRKEDGYALTTYGPGLEYLKNLFNEPGLNYDYLITNEETGAICDINWNLILGKLWNILIQKKYFDYSTWSSFFKSYHLHWISALTQSALEKKIRAAMQIVSQYFLDPGSTSSDSLEKISCLFVTPTECMAYLNCNPGLSVPAKLTILFDALELMYEKDAGDIDDTFWQFAAENVALSDSFGRKFAEKYPEKLNDFGLCFLENPGSFHRLIKTSSMPMLKGLNLKLNYLPRGFISQLLQEVNELRENGLVCALIASKRHPELMRSFIQFMSKIDPSAVQHILEHQGPMGKNVLSVMLSMDKGHAELAREVVSIIATLPESSKRIILQCNQNNVLLKAIKDCPPAVPSIFNLMLSLDEISQNWITAYCLHANQFNKRSCFHRLLELNQRVNSLAKQPDNARAYRAAKKLQNILIMSLDDYFQNSKQPTAFSSLQNKWDEGIKTASVELDKLIDWRAFLLNLALVLLSIPLLGLPLAIIYHQTGYKRMFFQTETTIALENLDNTVHDPLFPSSIIAPV